MSPLAFCLVVAGALLHATWNLSAKRAAGSNGVAFVWIMGLVSLVFAAPFGVVSWMAGPQHLSWLAWVAIAASGVVHAVYFLVLQQGYSKGELSVVYPVARGTGPLFAVVGAVVLLGDEPSALGALGIVAILVGILLISGITRLSRRSGRLAGVSWGALTGLWIATYTLIDAWAVTSLGLDPLVFFFLSLILGALALAPWALRDTAALRTEWRHDLRPMIVVGVLSPVAYTLVLYAMRLAPLAYVAPLRELSMLVGVLYGARLLREKVTALRFAGAAFMVAGVVALALA